MTASPAPIVFFDIDGVLLPGRAFALPENKNLLNAKLSTMQRMEMARFQPEAITYLVDLCGQTGAQLVLMSSWGSGWWDRPDDLQDKFVSQGLARSLFHADWFPFGPGFEFGKHPKTLAWLRAHEVTSFVIIDDEPHLYQDEGFTDLQDAIVRTDPKIGLDETILSRALKVLAGRKAVA